MKFRVTLLLYIILFTRIVSSQSLVNLDLPSTTTLVSIDLPDLEYFKQGYVDEGYTDPTRIERSALTALANNWLHSITNEFLVHEFEQSTQQGEIYLTLQEFQSIYTSEIEPMISFQIQRMNAAKVIYSNWISSSVSAEEFYHETSTSNVFASLEEWVNFTQTMSSVADIQEYIDFLPTDVNKAFPIYQGNYAFSNFIDEWTLLQLEALNPTVASMVDHSEEIERHILLRNAARYMILSEHVNDISFLSSQDQDLWDDIYEGTITCGKPPEPLNQIWNPVCAGAQ